MKNLVQVLWTFFCTRYRWLVVCLGACMAPMAACLAATPVHIELHFSPPWSYEGPDKTAIGIEPELLRAALRSQGYEPTFNLVSNARLFDDFSAKRVQFASPAGGAVNNPGQYRTQPYLPFLDGAMTLATSKLRIDSVADLYGKRIVAYQLASKFRGPEFAKMAQENPAYRERAQREIQIEQLFQGRVDVVVGERRILNYLATKMYGPGKVQFHEIFPPDHMSGLSWDPELVAAVDRGMQKLRDSGEYKKILDAPR